MTRNEQILSEVQKRFSSNDTHLVSKINIFIDGARWADDHPKPEMVNKQEFIEKACNWLVGNAEDSVESALYLVTKFKQAMEE